MAQVSLSLLHSLHTAVDGPHEGLLGQTLTITNNRDTQCTNVQNKSNLNTKYAFYVGEKLRVAI